MMTPHEYQKLVQRTKAGLHNTVSSHNEDLLHGAMGCATEAGELLDAVKKHLYYGKSLDIHNIHEEIGDVLWYLAVLAEWSGANLGELMEANIEKLRIRYPEKFTQECALARDTEKEMQPIKKKRLECKECDGTGEVDSGGFTPYGASIYLPCPSCCKS